MDAAREKCAKTLPIDITLKATVCHYGLWISQSKLSHTHTHTSTQFFLAQATCQTIVAKSAACNKRWKELEKWKWWFNAVMKTGAQRAMTEWKPIQTDLMHHGISSTPQPQTALRNAKKNPLYCPQVLYTHPPFALSLSGFLHFRFSV